MRSGKLSGKDVRRQFLGLLLSTFILLLTSVMPLCHTCHLHCAWHAGRAVSGVLHISRNHAGGEQADTDGPCLACMFLNAINATQVPPLFFLLSGLTKLFSLPFPRAEVFRAEHVFSAFSPRAPPHPFWDF